LLLLVLASSSLSSARVVRAALLLQRHCSLAGRSAGRPGALQKAPVPQVEVHRRASMADARDLSAGCSAVFDTAEL
jgi:hypothetical protein